MISGENQANREQARLLQEVKRRRSDISPRLMVFERHMTTYEVAPRYWVTHLLPSLDSRGSRLIASMVGASMRTSRE